MHESELLVGDIITLKEGLKIPCDGIIFKATSNFLVEES